MLQESESSTGNDSDADALREGDRTPAAAVFRHVPRERSGQQGLRERRFRVFDPKNRIHWLAVIVIAIILILIFGVTSTASV